MASRYKTARRQPRKPQNQTSYEALESRQMLTAGTVVINEILYNPGGGSQHEWVELHNQLAVDVDLSRWSLQEGVNFTFPTGTILGGGEFLVVASDPAALQASGVTAAIGPFTGQLSNGGETIELRNNSERLIDSIDYSDDGLWPIAADGSGASLAKVAEGIDGTLPANWRASAEVGGTPGESNVTSVASQVAINEVLATPDSYQIELFNHGSGTVQLGGYTLTQAGGGSHEVTLSTQSLAAGSFAVIDAAALGFSPSDGDRLFLYESGETVVADAAIVTSTLSGRITDGTGAWFTPDQPTFGSANSFDLRDEIVINEIFYHSAPQYPAAAETESLPLINFDSAWRFNQSDGDLGTSWAQSAHEVGGNWEIGSGVLAFEPDGLPIEILTELDSPSGRIYYFESEFDLTAAQLADSSAIELAHLVDDGAVFYLNGVEFARYGIPGEIGDPITTFANRGGEAILQIVDLPLSELLIGSNRISVEVHQTSNASSDVVFGASVAAIEEVTPAVPFAENELEWVELYNRSAQSTSLADWQLDDGIEFEFPAAATIAANGYVVITNNRAAFIAEYPAVDPAIVLGDFSGKLSNSTERLVLLDEVGNPADEVTYFDDGRFADAADGGGSSLELRDSDSDNSIAEAWAASDESNKSSWQTYTYTGIANPPPGSNQPAVFNEFIFGLLDSGELLLDDISVIQDPSGAAVQLIQNGGFENDLVGGDADKWRILGNHGGHGLSSIVVDPTDANNNALHIVATGGTDSLSNHGETTLKDGNTFVAIQNNETYEISFRAKWISGSPQLNTRLYFDRVAQTTIIETADSSGTPGAVNSTAEANVGPTFTDFGQSVSVPAPGQAVQIYAQAHDNDGVSQMTLLYSVNGGSFQSATMTVNSAGQYVATIPGTSDGTIVQFYVAAEDNLGAVSTFPAEGVDSRALYRVEASTSSPTGAPNFRIIMTDADATFLHDPTNVQSNDFVGATVVYDDVVYYDVGLHLRSSLRGRWDATRLGYTIRFDPSQLFRGTNSSVRVDRSGRARGASGLFGQGEIVSWHIINQAGDIPGFYNDLAYVVAPQDIHSSSAQLVLTGYNNDYLDSQFEDGSDGTLYKFTPIYHPIATATTTGGPEGLKFASDRINGARQDDVLFVPIQDFGDDPESYRYNYVLENNRAEDDFGPAIRLAQTFSLPTAEFNETISDVIDVDTFLRTAAVMTLLGASDNYFTGSLNNLVLYERPEDGKILFFPWDHDWQGRSATASLVPNNDVQRVINASPGNLRAFFSHLNDILDTTFNPTYTSYWTNHYDSLVSSNQNFGAIQSYIASRHAYVTGQLNNLVSQAPFAITTNGGANFTVNQATAVVRGTGGLDVHEFRLAGSNADLQAIWVNNNTWDLVVPLESGLNPITIEAIGFDGTVIASDSITITSTLNDRLPQAALRISELHYNPADPSASELAAGFDNNDDFEFIELVNPSTTGTINLNGVQFSDGVSFEFGDRDLLPGERVVIAEDVDAFMERYGDTATVLGQWSGALNNGGERVTLLDSSLEEIMSVNYGDNDPWDSAADGQGFSLVLKDPINTPVDELGKYYSWRSSTVLGGTPGEASIDRSGVVVNEVLAHSDAPLSDSIELFNTTNATISVGGWYLSDEGDELFKYQIPAGTSIAAGGYLVFDESDFNVSATGFALSGSEGDQVYLSAADGDFVLLQDAVEFGATFNGESLGRLSDDTGRLTRLAETSFGSANGAAEVGPLVISEVNYHPEDPSSVALAIDTTITDNDLEYIEIANPTSADINLTDWRIRGEADFDFAPGTTLTAGEAIVVVPFDPTIDAAKLNAFQAHYGIGAEVTIVGGLSASLSNSSGRIALQQPDTPDALGVIPNVVVDQVVYDDLLPFPNADGSGQSLERDDFGASGNLATTWVAAAPTPGAFEAPFILGDADQNGVVDFSDIGPFITLLAQEVFLDQADINGDGEVDFSDIGPFISILAAQ